MLEQETETILQTLAGRTIGTRDSIRLAEVMQADIPRSVKAYMRAEVIRWMEKDTASTPALGRIDRTAPGVDRLTKHFLRTIGEHYRFPRDEFLTMLDNAVHFAENYLCRPEWTLASFLYNNAASASPEEIVSRLDYFVEYAYFPTLIERTLGESREPLSAEAFTGLVASIDDQVVRQHNARELAILMKPIFDFLLLCDAPDDAQIRVKPVIVFLEDKRLRSMRDFIEKVCHNRNTEMIQRSGLAQLLEDLFLGNTSAAEPPEVESPAPSAEEMEPPTEEPAPLASSSSVEPPVDTVKEDIAREPGDTRKNISLSLTFSGMAEPPRVEQTTAHGLPDLKGIISPEMQDQYVRKIFMNDYDYFARVIAALNSFGTWDEAGSYLDRLYELNGLNPSRPEIEEFTTVVRTRYPRGGGPAA